MYVWPEMNTVSLRNIIFLFFALLWLSSCGDEPCNEDMSTNIKVGFYKKDTADVLNKFTIDSLFITLGYFQRDTLTNIQRIAFPFNTTDSVTSLIFSLDTLEFIYDSVPDSIFIDTVNIDTTVVTKKWAINDTNRIRLTDTIDFNYMVNHEFVSHECGYKFVFDSVKYSHTKKYLKEIKENAEPSAINEADEDFKFIFY